MANLLKYFDGGLPGRPQKRKPTEEQKKFLDIWKKEPSMAKIRLEFEKNDMRVVC